MPRRTAPASLLGRLPGAGRQCLQRLAKASGNANQHILYCCHRHIADLAGRIDRSGNGAAADLRRIGTGVTRRLKQATEGVARHDANVGAERGGDKHQRVHRIERGGNDVAPDVMDAGDNALGHTAHAQRQAGTDVRTGADRATHHLLDNGSERAGATACGAQRVGDRLPHESAHLCFNGAEQCEAVDDALLHSMAGLFSRAGAIATGRCSLWMLGRHYNSFIGKSN